MKWWGQRKRLTIMQDALFSEYLTRRQNHQAGLKVKTRYSNGKQTWELTRILIYSYGFPIRLGTGFGLFCFWITPSLTSGSAFLTYSDAKHPLTDKPRLSASNVFSPSIGTSRYQWRKRRKGNQNQLFYLQSLRSVAAAADRWGTCPSSASCSKAGNQRAVTTPNIKQHKQSRKSTRPKSSKCLKGFHFSLFLFIILRMLSQHINVRLGSESKTEKFANCVKLRKGEWHNYNFPVSSNNMFQ